MENSAGIGAPADRVNGRDLVVRSDYLATTPSADRLVRPSGQRGTSPEAALSSMPIRIAVTSAWARLAAPSFW